MKLPSLHVPWQFSSFTPGKEVYGCKIQRAEEAKCFPDVNREGHSKCWRILMGEDRLHLRLLFKLSSAEDQGRRGCVVPVISKGPSWEPCSTACCRAL